MNVNGYSLEVKKWKELIPNESPAELIPGVDRGERDA